MRERIGLRGKLTYANVMSTMCFFLLLGGGAYAAGHLGKNTVGTKQLKKNSVTTAKIKKNAVTGAKVKNKSLTGSDLADGTITGSNVQDGSLSGANIDQSSLTSVRASNVIGVSMNSDCTAAAPFPSGVSAVPSGKGCKVTFGSSVLNCAVTATVAFRTDGVIILAERTVQTLRRPSEPTEIFVSPLFGESATSLPVDLTMVC